MPARRSRALHALRIGMLRGSLEDSPDVGPFSRAIGAISMTFGGRALYYAEFFAGEIRRIRYVGGPRS